VQRGAEQVQQAFTIVVIPVLPITITTAAINGAGVFEATVAELILGKNYVFVRTTNLSDFDYVAGSAVVLDTFTATTNTRMVADPNPPAGKAFYRVQEYTP
jgi:hypothetical protein